MSILRGVDVLLPSSVEDFLRGIISKAFWKIICSKRSMHCLLVYVKIAVH